MSTRGGARAATLACLALLGVVASLVLFALMPGNSSRELEPGGVTTGSRPGTGETRFDGEPSNSDAAAQEDTQRTEVPADNGEAQGEAPETQVAAGQTASLRVHTPAVIGELISGPNSGRKLRPSDTQPGSLFADELFPGFARLRVLAGGGVSVERDVLLLARRELELSIALAERAPLHGLVVDGEGVALVDVQLELEGARARTDGNGRFEIARALGEECVLRATKSGYGSYRRVLYPDEGGSLDAPINLRMRAAGSLTIHLAAGGRTRTQADVYLFPGGAVPMDGNPARHVAPWPDLLPLRIAPGGAQALRDLPVGRYRVIALHSELVYPARDVWINASAYTELTLEQSPAESVELMVQLDGEPCAAARARLIFADPNYVTLRSLGGDARHARNIAIDLHPAARLWSSADTTGRVVLGLAASEAPTHVELVGPRGITRRLGWTPPASGDWAIELGDED